MDLSFAQPWGLLGLLGIPAVLAIHLLQRRAVVIPSSTLFLLESLNRESQGGRRPERLRPSLPLWLQLLAVLLLTWLLAQPQWMDKTSVLRMAVVLDGSASMTVAKKALLESLPRDLARLASVTAQSEIHVLDSRLERAPLYHGPGGDALLPVLRAWEPSGGSHDPAPALRLARNLAGSGGLVLFATDGESAALPTGVRLYACGQPVANAGLAGVGVEEGPDTLQWKATLRNYSASPVTRELKVMAGETVVSAESLTLPAHGLLQRQGPFPSGIAELDLRLSPDAFVLDDHAPLLRPRLKEITVSLPPDQDPGGSLYSALFSSLPGVKTRGTPVQVPVVAYNPLSPELPEGPAVIFVRDPKPNAVVLPGALLVEPDPLTEGLGWQGLICQDSLRIPPQENDDPLIWIGDRPVVFLRTAGSATQLCFNFDLRKSNARRLPALVLTLHRWLEDFRRRLPGEEWTLSECGQRLEVAPLAAPAPAEFELRLADGPAVTRRPVREAALLQAPASPGVLEIWQGDQRLLRTASHFADIREADFTGKGTRNDLEGAAATVIRQQSREDPAWRGWLVLLLGVAGFSWWWQGRSSQSQNTRAVRMPPDVSSAPFPDP